MVRALYYRPGAGAHYDVFLNQGRPGAGTSASRPGATQKQGEILGAQPEAPRSSPFCKSSGLFPQGQTRAGTVDILGLTTKGPVAVTPSGKKRVQASRQDLGRPLGPTTLVSQCRWKQGGIVQQLRLGRRRPADSGASAAAHGYTWSPVYGRPARMARPLGRSGGHQARRTQWRHCRLGQATPPDLQGRGHPQDDQCSYPLGPHLVPACLLGLCPT